MSKRKRRYFSPEDKVSLLKRHLLDKVPVSDICDENDLQPVTFYGWQKQLFEQGVRAFQNPKDGKVRSLEKHVFRLSSKLQKKNEVLSELMEEHLSLKKNLGEV